MPRGNRHRLAGHVWHIAERRRNSARARYRGVENVDGLSILRDDEAPYSPHFGVEIARLSDKSTVDFVES
jgi:hypothetical protein